MITKIIECIKDKLNDRVDNDTYTSIYFTRGLDEYYIKLDIVINDLNNAPIQLSIILNNEYIMFQAIGTIIDDFNYASLSIEDLTDIERKEYNNFIMELEDIFAMQLYEILL